MSGNDNRILQQITDFHKKSQKMVDTIIMLLDNLPFTTIDRASLQGIKFKRYINIGVFIFINLSIRLYVFNIENMFVNENRTY